MKNIFLIHTHDSGRLFSFYGEAVPTPNLKHFAEKASVFRKCFCAGPTCSPSRSAQLTGMYPHQNGMLGLAHRGFSLKEPSCHMASYLHNKGYNSILCGIQHETDNPKLLGYDQVIGIQDYDMGSPYLDMTAFDHDNAAALGSFLDNYNRSRPLFVSMGFYNTHRVFPRDDGSVSPDFLSLPKEVVDTPESREDMAGYHRSVKIVDDCFGEVVSAIERNGYLDDSLIVFTTDHGPAFPRMKCTLYDGGIGVAFMIYYRDNPSNGRVIDSMVSHLDLFPTICDYASIEAPDWLIGTSLIPLLEGRKGEIHNAIFSEINFHAAYQPMRAIRTERYKYIRNYHYNRRQVLANIDECPEKKFLTSNGLREMPTAEAELYDLYFDPVEHNNLINDSSITEIREKLAKRLDEWMIENNDPLIEEKVIKRPEGALVNKQSCEDPGIADWE